MSEIQTLIRDEAVRLLEAHLVDVVVGFKAGTTSLHPQPAFVTNVQEAQNLLMDGFCQNNLATYLTRLPKEQKIGLVARGCETRAAHALVVENQHARDRLYLIGIPCQGILSWRKIEAEVGEDVLSAEETGKTVFIKTRNGNFKLNRQDFIHDTCLHCQHPDPVSPDIMLGDPSPITVPESSDQLVQGFAILKPSERYAYFSQEAERCIRCYACREACPMCYCTECFVDHTSPRWAESMISPSGTHAWHIIRAFHQTGRCVSCGACERACPMDIKMTYLTDKLNLDMRQEYGFEVGMDDASQPPFAAFSLDDKDQFVS